jgi:hypothetical protein
MEDDSPVIASGIRVICGNWFGQGVFKLYVSNDMQKIFLSLDQSADYLKLVEPETLMQSETFLELPDWAKKHLHNKRVEHFLDGKELALLRDTEDEYDVASEYFGDTYDELVEYEGLLGQWVEQKYDTKSLGPFASYKMLTVDIDRFEHAERMEEKITGLMCQQIEAWNEDDESRTNGFRSSAEEHCYYVSKNSEVLMRAFPDTGGYWPDDEDENNRLQPTADPDSIQPILDAFVSCEANFRDTLRFEGLPREETQSIMTRHFRRMEKAKLELILDLLEHHNPTNINT